LQKKRTAFFWKSAPRNLFLNPDKPQVNFLILRPNHQDSTLQVLNCDKFTRGYALFADDGRDDGSDCGSLLHGYMFFTKNAAVC